MATRWNNDKILRFDELFFEFIKDKHHINDIETEKQNRKTKQKNKTENKTETSLDSNYLSLFLLIKDDDEESILHKPYHAKGGNKYIFFNL